jgi:predicted nucleic acid-binding protein
VGQESEYLVATVAPADAHNKFLVWESSDPAVAEIKRWVVSTENGAARGRIDWAVTQFLEACFQIQSNVDIVDAWAMIASEAKARGRMSKPSPPGSQIDDVWIAATAYASNLTPLACDKGFGWMAGIGVDVLIHGG